MESPGRVAGEDVLFRRHRGVAGQQTPAIGAPHVDMGHYHVTGKLLAIGRVVGFRQAVHRRQGALPALAVTHLGAERARGDDRSYLAKLKTKIRGNVILPPGLQGNPASVFRVTQLPSGEVIDVRLIKSSGNLQLDAAVERAIRKSSPLPTPEGRSPDRIIDITYLPFEKPPQ